MSKRPVQLTIISDLICPYCYIGHYELQEAIAKAHAIDLPVEFEIQYRPFRLATGLDEDIRVDRVDWFSKKFGEARFRNTLSVLEKWTDARAASSEDDEAPPKPKWSFGGMMSQSTRAHRLSLKAFRLGGQPRQQELLTELFKAFTEESKDIGDIGVLSEIAERTQLMSRDEAERFLTSDELREEVDEMIEEVRQNGITGVPFTVIDGRWAVSGGQSADIFLQIFKKLATLPTPAEEAAAEAAAQAEAEAKAQAEAKAKLAVEVGVEEKLNDTEMEKVVGLAAAA